MILIMFPMVLDQHTHPGIIVESKHSSKIYIIIT